MTDYYVWDGATGAANGTSFTDAWVTLEAADGTAGDDDVVHVASDHVESGTSAFDYTFSNGCWLITEDRVGGGYESMVAGGGSITNTGTTDITVDKGTWKGFHFISADLITFTPGTGVLTMIDCRFEHTANDDFIEIGGGGPRILFIDCDIIQPNTPDNNINHIFKFINDGVWFNMVGGSIDARYKQGLMDSNYSGKGTIEGVDLSLWSSTATTHHFTKSGNESHIKFIGNDLPNVTFTYQSYDYCGLLDVINTDDSTGNDAYYMQRDTKLGQLITNSATYKTTGGYSPSESADILSWQITDKNLSGSGPMFETFAFGHQYNETLTSQTVTVEVMLANDGAITDVDSDDIGLFVRHFDASADTTLSSGIYTSPTIGDPLTTATTYSESGSAGNGWTYGGAKSTKKAFSITQSFTAGRKGAIECIVWVRNIPASHELFVNPVLTLS